MVEFRMFLYYFLHLSPDGLNQEHPASGFSVLYHCLGTFFDILSWVSLLTSIVPSRYQIVLAIPNLMVHGIFADHRDPSSGNTACQLGFSRAASMVFARLPSGYCKPAAILRCEVLTDTHKSLLS